MPAYLTLRRLFCIGVLLVAAACLLSFGYALATGAYLDQAASRGQTTLRLAIAGLRGHIDRFEPLPALIADHDDIKELVASPNDAVLRGRANVYLKEINDLLRSSDIYVMMDDGNTIAASNYDQPTSFVGENFAYRPYFQDAVQGRNGRFFALGTTSLKRGYYFSSPIQVGSDIRGVVVFKVDMDAIEASWQGGDNEIIVADPEGIIFMTGRKDWLYAGLLPLTRERIARTEQSKRYANATLTELPVSHSSYDGRLPLLTVSEGGERREYLDVSDTMEDAGWTVHVLLDTRSAHAQASTVAVSLFLVLGLAALAGLILWQRRARLAERLELQRSARIELEHRVDERTATLASVNRQLETEIDERRATERQLRQTQADLVQAGKLAALGQMSAALSHEFNQPLTAVKTYADNALVLLDRERIAEARDNVSRISGLSDRMASISKHLRNFARKPNEQLGPVELESVIDDTLAIVASRLKSARAIMSIDLGPAPLMVRAGAVRLQQVLVNIISNAADAVEGAHDRRIELSVKTAEGRVRIAVRDHGPGVPNAIAERIFDPFFTTKGVGKGLGLGLSISYNIVKDFGGSLSIDNHPDGGAVFTIELDAMPMQRHEAAE
ncbi:sensor histidine kinase [Corticibacterium sp. UT-5YL-CI-8]|nr:sensor histidine kinase [Tianweitania sp. UT-5YL-CI-8]